MLLNMFFCSLIDNSSKDRKYDDDIDDEDEADGVDDIKREGDKNLKGGGFCRTCVFGKGIRVSSATDFPLVSKGASS